MKNENTIDRLIRVFVSGLLGILAFFWLGGILAIIGYFLALGILITAFTGFCGIYKVCRIDTTRMKGPEKKWPIYLLIIFIGGSLVAGAYGSHFFTKKFFLEDYNRMNNYYKQTLFLTGQGNHEEAILNYNYLITDFEAFKNKYSKFKPFAIKFDKAFDDDLNKVESILRSLSENIQSGDLQEVHISLEAVRPIFQGILKRNHFSLLAVSLVDFHDSMEEILSPADEKNTAQVLSVYPTVDIKLKEVEAIENDAEIQAIRTNLEDLKKLAEQNKSQELPAKGAELKSSFVKVYLKRG